MASVNGSAAYSVTISPYNINQASISLSISGCPSGAVCSFDNNPVNIGSNYANPNGQTYLRVTGNSVALGSYLLTVSASGISKTHTASVVLSVGTPAHIAVPSSLTFNANAYSTPPDQAYTIQNTGGTPSNWIAYLHDPYNVGCKLNGMLGSPYTTPGNGLITQGTIAPGATISLGASMPMKTSAGNFNGCYVEVTSTNSDNASVTSQLYYTVNAPAQLMCDNTWHDIPGGGATEYQPVVSVAGSGLRFTAIGYDKQVYYQDAINSGGNFYWGGSWASLGNQTYVSPYTYTQASIWVVNILGTDYSTIWGRNYGGSSWYTAAATGQVWGTPYRTNGYSKIWQVKNNNNSSIQYLCTDNGTTPACESLAFNPATSGFSDSSTPTTPLTTALTVTPGATFYTFVDMGAINSVTNFAAPGGYTCNWVSWFRTAAVFQCTAPSTPGSSTFVGGTYYDSGYNICDDHNHTIGTVTVGAAGAAPNISVNPTATTFSIAAGNSATTPASRAVTITTTIANSTLKWKAEPDQTWCHISPASGTVAYGSNSTATITMDPLSDAGAHTCVITFSDNGSAPAVTGGSKTTTITYTVTPNNVGCTGPQCGGTGGSNPITTDTSQCGKITVTWQRATGAGTYAIYRNTTQSISGPNAVHLLPDVADTGASSYSKTDASPAVGTTYYYVIRVLNGGISSPANIASEPVQAVACPPGQVSSGSFTAVTNVCRQITLSWQAPTGNPPATSYWIFRNQTGITPTPTAGNPGADLIYATSSLSYVDKGLDPVQYYYWISAVNGSSPSAPSPLGGGGSVWASDCFANVNPTDKDITGLNGVTFTNPNMSPGHNACDGYTAIPSDKEFHKGDVVSFRIQVCNTDAANSQGDATNVVVTDSLTNLKIPDDGQGWQARYVDADGNSHDFNQIADCTSPVNEGDFSVCGPVGTQTLTFNIGTVPKLESVPITYNASPTVPVNYQGNYNRFQNSADVDFAGGSIARPAATPFIPFTTGATYPSRGEY